MGLLEDMFGDRCQVVLRSEREFLRELGLPTYDGPLHEWVYVGEVSFVDSEDRRYATVRIWVQAMPSKFWKFEVDVDELDPNRFELGTVFPTRPVTLTLRTGSGTLEDHWPYAAAVAEGMLVIDKEYK